MYLRIVAVALAASSLMGCQAGPSPGSRSAEASHPMTMAAAPAPAPAPVTAPEIAQVTTAEAVPAPPTGRPCRVYLRRDALGMAGASPLAPSADGLMNRGTMVEGMIDQVGPDWIVLKTDAGRTWVPRSVVLIVEVLK